MLSPRLVVSAMLFLVIGGVIAGVVMTWLPPSPKRLAFDSYSGRKIGHRALFELLEALDIKVSRNLSTPAELLKGQNRVLMIKPEIRNLEIERAYLEQLGRWLKAGGELVLVSDFLDFTSPSLRDDKHIDHERVSSDSGQLHKILGINELSVVNRQDTKDKDTVRDKNPSLDVPRTRYSVRMTGSLSTLQRDVKALYLPKPTPCYFSGKAISSADGVLEVATDSKSWRPIVLKFNLGKGKVILISDPFTFTNIDIDKEDNAVLAYHLAVGSGDREVVFDEYYHGALTRGNWMALLGIPTYGFIGVCVLLASLLWAWFVGVRFGPPVSRPEPSRRSILEYIDAMARLFQRGRKHHFILSTCREGFISDLQNELHYPPGTAEEVVFDRLAQIDPVRLKRIQDAFSVINRHISNPRRISLNRLTQLQEILDKCRNRTQTPNSRMPSSTYTSWRPPRLKR
jgi:hypothetical protein